MLRFYQTLIYANNMANLINPGKIEYEAVIQESKLSQGGSATWVEFNRDLKETFGKGNLVPVVITFDKKVKYVGSLAKMGGPLPMILLRKDIQEQVGKKAGDNVHVTVELDTKKRKIELTKDEVQALKKAGLLEKFKSISYTHQREYHQWISEAKKPETRAARIEKMIGMLSASKK
jgi:hypothetical protein